MKTNKQRLEEITTETSSHWDHICEDILDKKSYSKKSFSIATHINLLMIDRKMKKKDLAKKMNVSPQQISKWLKGNCNYNLETICKFEEIFNTSLIKIPEQSYSFDKIHYSKKKTISMNLLHKWDISKDGKDSTTKAA